ncbi:cation:proton antiporter [Streptomyces tricolor]|nr:cation:proton antiporter [Streptomyces tricolor]
MLAAVVRWPAGAAPARWYLLLLVPYTGGDAVGGASAVAPAARRRCRHGLAEPAALTAVLAGLLVSRGPSRRKIGLHFIFGAFFFGVVMPKESAWRLRADITDRIGEVSSHLLLPVFFISVGLKVDLSGPGAVRIWLDTGLILLGRGRPSNSSARVH